MESQGNGSKVIQISSESSNSSSAVIALKQIDLAEERLLARLAREAIKEHKEKRASIRKALESGVELEPGIRTAVIVTKRVLVVR